MCFPSARRVQFANWRNHEAAWIHHAIRGRYYTREYTALAKFLNAAEDQFKALNLEPLDHQRSGLTLEMSGGYELQWQNGTVMLGRCHSGRREQLFRGSPSVESTWAKMLDVMRSQEQKVKLKANLPPADRRVRFDLEALRKNYQPR